MMTNPNQLATSSSAVDRASSLKVPIRRWVRVAHLWAGFGAGLWLAMLGLTGSALVYQHSLRQILEQGRTIRSGVPRLPISKLLERIRQQRPDVRVVDIDGLEYKGSALEVRIHPVNSTAPKRRSQVLLVDPGTGEIGAAQTSTGTFMGFLAQLHYNLLSGEIGLTINAFAGGLATFFTGSGLFLWWRGKSKWKNGLRMKFKGASSRVRNYSIHSALGFYSSIFFFILGLSGIYFAAPRPFLAAAARLNGTSLAVMKDFLNPPSSISPLGGADADADDVVGLARRQYPDTVLSEIELPTEPLDAWQFHFFSHGNVDFGDAELVAIDRRSAKVLVAKRTADLPIALRVVILLRPLHYGTIGGQFTRVLWVLLGLTPTILFVTGFILWRKRVNAALVADR